jgi:hypothetical protein
MKENLKPCTYKQSEGGPLRWRLMACLLWNEPASYAAVRQVKGKRCPEPERKRVRTGRQFEYCRVDPKPRELSMARLKRS